MKNDKSMLNSMESENSPHTHEERTFGQLDETLKHTVQPDFITHIGVTKNGAQIQHS